MSERATVLCLVDRRRAHLTNAVEVAGYRVLEALTTDHAVALCAQRAVDAALLDQGVYTETADWSVAQSMKLVRPSVFVVLMTRATLIGPALPKGVDAVVSRRGSKAAVEVLDKFVGPESRLPVGR